MLQLQDHPLAGRIWDPRTAAFISEEALFGRTVSARHVVLGENHDNPEHHRLQRVALKALAARGAPRALALEQFDSEHQQALGVARGNGADAEALADAGRFDRKGWDWPLYRPLVEFALEHGWPLVAANLSRTQARTIVADPTRSGLPPADAELRNALERDMIESHCGKRPDAKRLAGMVEAQRARDAHMARQLADSGARGSVLVTGNGHARRDRGVPLYLSGVDLVTIGFIEVETGKFAPGDYTAKGFAGAASFDFIWFTARAEREDPCGRLGRSIYEGKAL